MPEVPKMTIDCPRCHNVDHKMTLMFDELNKLSKKILQCDHCGTTYKLEGITIVLLSKK